jgi:hypothetical protein
MECGGCTLCCKLIDIPWMNSPAGEYCRECEINKGCKIYNTTLPKDCKDYQCAYAQMDKCSINLRPDKCGMIFERFDDNIFTGLYEIEISEEAKNQIQNFVEQGFSVLVNKFGTSDVSIYTNSLDPQEIFNKVKNGRTNIHN